MNEGDAYRRFALSPIEVLRLLGHVPGIQRVWVSPLTPVMIPFGLGVELLLFVLCIGDIGQAVTVVLQLGFWFTRSFYTPLIVSEAFRPIVHIDPMIPVVQRFQNVILFSRTLDLSALLLS